VLHIEVLDLLKEEISEGEYRRYIQKLQYDEKNSKSDIAIFVAPNPLISRWVKTKYKQKIAHLFEVKTGKKPQIEIVTKSFSHPKEKSLKKPEKERSQAHSTILNPSYTFDSFVVGSSNQVAYSVAASVSEKPGKLYNPLFIYGFSGLGKTHLLHAIGNDALAKGATVIYATSEEFMNDFTYNLRNQTPDRFRAKYRECDFLLIDDIQFFSGKEETQKEFFHTFNELHAQNKQIILTSDKAPKKIAGFEDRLKSRFEWGMLIDIQPPELETKISIIKKKCELDGIELNDDIVQYIATNMGDNIREIESAIITLNGYASMMNQTITLDFAKDVMKEQIKEKKESIDLEDIIKVISKELNIKPSDIKSKKRSKNIVEARRIGIYLARTLTPNSMPALAQYFGMKDHTAVSHNMRKINQMLEENENFRLRVEELKNSITTKND
jgi:chromosomal replication initiator protein